MPELPEVHALVADLRTRLTDRAITRLDLVAFSALKTYDPPPSALGGALVDGVRRHGKFLDIEAAGLHLVIHLARGGWIRWRDEVPATPPRPSAKSPLAARVNLDPGEPRSTSPRRGRGSGWRSTSSATPRRSPASPAWGPTR